MIGELENSDQEGAADARLTTPTSSSLPPAAGPRQPTNAPSSALRRMDNAGLPITFDAVAREAEVSRSWLYTQPDLRAEIERLRARDSPRRRTPPVPTGNAPPTPPCCSGWRPPPSASAIWRPKTSSSARRSPTPSVEQRDQRHSRRPPRHAENKIRRHHRTLLTMRRKHRPQHITAGQSHAPSHQLQITSGLFAANCAWLACAVIAHNLLRAAGTLAGGDAAVARGATLRRDLINVPARFAAPARKPMLHLPAHWPRQTGWKTLWDNVIGHCYLTAQPRAG